ncbi:MAG: hypothetical protein N2111_13865 [Candidatus Sumerlaeaceae bacterium]|nr:hypothetical protein [Candidatus Sumerlaeaceae bacterium]
MAVTRLGNNIYVTSSGDKVEFTTPVKLIGIYAFGVADGTTLTVSLSSAGGSTTPIWSGQIGTWQTSGDNYLLTGRVAGNTALSVPVPPSPGGIVVTANPTSGMANGRVVLTISP